jgi:hypothetical protein
MIKFKLFEALYSFTIFFVELVQIISIKYKMLDSQLFLDYQDCLNILSLDPDRK